MTIAKPDWTPEQQIEFYRNSFHDEAIENQKLRLILFWTAEHLPKDKIPELIDKIRHDAVADMDEDDEEFRLKVAKAVNRICDIAHEGATAPAGAGDPSPAWWAKLDEAANQLRGFIIDLETEGTLRKLRRLETKRRGEK